VSEAVSAANNATFPDWIDRRPDGSKIFANFDQERRHMSERVFYAVTNGGSSARQSWPNSYLLINTFYFGLPSDRGFFGYKKT